LKIPLICPPIREQQAVVDFVSSGTEDTNRLITRTEREIGLIREYRTRLVADVVTGQLDVREAAAKLPDEPEAEELEEFDESTADEDNIEGEELAAGAEEAGDAG
jgi:type I restriction enzyme S subunit